MYSSINAFVDRDSLASATNGDCVVVEAAGMKGEDCASLQAYVCEKGWIKNAQTHTHIIKFISQM